MAAVDRPGRGAARRARRPARPALRRLRRGAGAGRPDGARAARRLRADHRRDGDAPRHPGERRGRPADPGEEGAGAGARRVPGARRRRAAPSGCRWCSTASPACSRSRTAPCWSHAMPSPTSARQALSIADALVAVFPDDTEVRGLRAVVRLGLARRPGAGGRRTASRSPSTRWTGRAGTSDLLRAGLDDAAFAARGDGRFALEAAISGRAQRRPVGGGDRLAADRPALRGARAGVALPRGQRRPARRPGAARAADPEELAVECEHGPAAPGRRGAVVRPEGRGLRAGRPVLAHRSPRGGGRALPRARRRRAARARPSAGSASSRSEASRLSARIGPPWRP